jgi:hypothetical protein
MGSTTFFNFSALPAASQIRHRRSAAFTALLVARPIAKPAAKSDG